MEANARMADPVEVLKRSRRFDLVFKYALAKAWAAGTPEEIRKAEEAYLEMVRSRNGFYEGEPPRNAPEDFIGNFRETARSIRERGYDLSRPAIPVDGAGELLNGAHRLAACAAYGKPCPVVVSDMYPAGGSVHRTFEKGHIDRAVRDWGICRYLAEFPDGALAAEFAAMGPKPDAPFPDWRVRSRRAWRWMVVPALQLAWARLTLAFRPAAKRDKIRRRMIRERKKITGFFDLARYWEERR